MDKPQEELGRREWGEGVAVVEELVLKFCKFRREERDRPNRTNGKTSRDNLIAWGLMVRDKRETWHKSTKEAALDAELKIGCDVLGISHFCRKLGNDVAVKIRRRLFCSGGHLGAPWMWEGQTLGVEQKAVSSLWKSALPRDHPQE